MSRSKGKRHEKRATSSGRERSPSRGVSRGVLRIILLIALIALAVLYAPFIFFDAVIHDVRTAGTLEPSLRPDADALIRSLVEGQPQGG